MALDVHSAGSMVATKRQSSSFGRVRPTKGHEVHFAVGDQGSLVDKGQKHILDLMEMNVHMAINRKIWLSPINFDILQEYIEFKANFHHVSIRAQKKPEKKWHDLPYLVIDDAINVVLDCWLEEWHTALEMEVGFSKTIVQQKKEEAKLKMEQLTMKSRKDSNAKAKAKNISMQEIGK